MRRKDAGQPPAARNDATPSRPSFRHNTASSFRSTLIDALNMPPPARVPAISYGTTDTAPGTLSSSAGSQSTQSAPMQAPSTSRNTLSSAIRGPSAPEDIYSLSLAGHEAFSQSPLGSPVADEWVRQQHHGRSQVEWNGGDVFAPSQTSAGSATTSTFAHRASDSGHGPAWASTSTSSEAANAFASLAWQHQNLGTSPSAVTHSHRPDRTAGPSRGHALFTTPGLPPGPHSPSDVFAQETHFSAPQAPYTSSGHDWSRQQQVSPIKGHPSMSSQVSPVHAAGLQENASLQTVFEYRTPSSRAQGLPEDATLDSMGSYRSSLQQASPTPQRSAQGGLLSTQALDDSPALASRTATYHDGVQGSTSQMPSLGSMGMLAFSPMPGAGQQATVAMTPASHRRRPGSASSLLAATERVSLQNPQSGMTSLDAAGMVPDVATQAGLSYSWTSGAQTGGMHATRPSTGSSHSTNDPTFLGPELGLGLDFMAEDKDHEMIEHLVPEILPASTADDDVAMQVDEMGRLSFGPPSQRRDSVASSSTTSLGFESTSSRTRLGTWQQNDGSWATADGSWQASTEPSSVDNSFQDDSIGSAAGKSRTSLLPPASAPNALSRLPDSRPASSGGPASVGHSGANHNVIPIARELAQPQSATDYSEFGQSVPIDSMADERWRSWPRERAPLQRTDVMVTRSQAPTVSSTMALSVAPIPTVEAGVTSVTPGRARLTAEPYSKTSRSGRPSSSTSTSSRSSAGVVGGMDGAQTPSSAGPTRPRSGLLAAANAAAQPRSAGSSRSSISTGSDRGTERKATFVSALRRARGPSQGGLAGIISSRTMELSRPTDSADGRGTSVASMQGVASLDARNSKTADAGASAAGPSIAQRNWSRPTSQLQCHSETSGSPAVTPSVDDAALAAPSMPRPTASIPTQPTEAAATGGDKVGFNEVSAALDTLRTFLRQKSANDHALPQGGGATDDSSQSDPSSGEGSSSVAPRRTLRRAKGTLPPRGSVSISTDPPSQDEGMGRSGSHTRGQSLGSAPALEAMRQQDRLAVLHDVLERVRRLKEASESSEPQSVTTTGRDATGSTASMTQNDQQHGTMQNAHQRSQSSSVPTRRAMQKEFLAARAKNG